MHRQPCEDKNVQENTAYLVNFTAVTALGFPVFYPIAFSLDLNRIRMLNEPVDDTFGRSTSVLKDLASVAEGSIRCKNS